MDTETWPAPQPPPVKKMSTGKKVLIGASALLLVGVFFGAGEESAKQEDPSVAVKTAPYRVTTPDVVTPQEIIDVLGASYVDEFCNLLDASQDAGLSESELFDAFVTGYGAGPPSASAVWSALKSHCSY